MEYMQNNKNYAVFSRKQFENKLKSNELVNENTNMPYIYYKQLNGRIVQITEIFHDPNKKSLFDDAVYIGEVGNFYKATSKPILL
mgnify:CR=1 FL=1